jgi:hypothetical protein
MGRNRKYNYEILNDPENILTLFDDYCRDECVTNFIRRNRIPRTLWYNTIKKLEPFKTYFEGKNFDVEEMNEVIVEYIEERVEQFRLKSLLSYDTSDSSEME